jgi:glycosyltransferase involved in cell wall biosynthesis
MVLVYHNITPPEYFIDVHPVLVQQCYLGRRELAMYASRCDLALGDSEYNRQELEAAGFPRTDVLPVVPDFSHLSGPADYGSARAFDDNWVNLLFVGRMIPNKKIDDLIRWFTAYKRWFSQRVRLLLVGSSGGFERYTASLLQLIDHLGIPDVHLLGHVSNEELVACYEVADVFVCASEHEGFCVPIVEAFHMGVPVVAYAATAVPATMDGGGVLLETKDPLTAAAVIHEVATNEALQDRLIASQDAALARLAARDFAGTLLRFIDQVKSSPRIPRPPVVADFWEHVEQSAQLAAIRVHRPGAFQALPKPGKHEDHEDHEDHEGNS